MFADPRVEQMTGERLRDLQLDLLKKELRWAEQKSRFYQESFAAAGVRAADLETLDDLSRFPFTDSRMLAESSVYDRLTLPLSQILRYSSVDLKGSLVEMMYTKGDIEHSVTMLIRALMAAGVMRASTVGFLGDLSDSRLLDFSYAIESIGAMAVPMGSDCEHWMEVGGKVPLDTLIGTDKLIMQFMIHHQAERQGVDRSTIRRVIHISQTGIQNVMQSHIMTRMNAEVYNLYAPTELGTAGMFYQCGTRVGSHIAEDFFYPEVVEFGGNQPVDHMGELVVTSLLAEALPLIRYRTGQAVSFADGVCHCGRTHRRIVTSFITT